MSFGELKRKILDKDKERTPNIVYKAFGSQ